MFTGIVETTGRVAQVDRAPDGRRLRIDVPSMAGEFTRGQSLAVDGVCLTVEEENASGVTVFLSEETVARTALDRVSEDDFVNLERAMPADGRFDGHLVQGHVDTTTTIERIESIGEDWRMRFAIPPAFDQYLVEKGSITIDGISLTIADRSDSAFEVAIIPTSYEQTTLSERAVDDLVNVEVDIIAKYVASMLADRGAI